MHGIKFSAPSKWVTRNGTDCAANKHKLSLFPLLLLFVIFTRAPKRMHAIFSFVAQSPSPFCTCPSDCKCACLCVCVLVYTCVRVPRTAVCLHSTFVRGIFPLLHLSFVHFILLQGKTRKAATDKPCSTPVRKVFCGFTGVNVCYLARLRVCCR